MQSLSRLKRWTTHQASGYDRGGGFYDSGNFLRTEPDRRHVLMECDGPGVIDRLWFTYKGEYGAEPYDLLVYLDDTHRPAIAANLDDLFAGQREPFIEPLAGRCGAPKTPGRYSHVPLGFARSAKVVLQPTASPERYKYRENSLGIRIPHVYYHVTFRRLPPGTPVRPFSWQLDLVERDALTRWRALVGRAGDSPWAGVRPMITHTVQCDVEASQTVLLAERAAPGVIAGIRLRAERIEELELLAFWDGASEPAIATPLGPFFGCGTAAPREEVCGLWFGHVQGIFYNHLPMPFHRSARLVLRSSGTERIRISSEVAVLTDPLHPDDLPLRARRYRHAPPPLGEAYLVLDEHGEGHFAGLVMDGPGHMEGDEMFFVDGEMMPSWHGTGTEDFFNFAWGLSHTEALPLHGITRQPGGPVAYRVHLPAGVPFRRSLRIAWEHGHDSQRGPNLDQSNYSGLVFYYAR